MSIAQSVVRAPGQHGTLGGGVSGAATQATFEQTHGLRLPELASTQAFTRESQHVPSGPFGTRWFSFTHAGAASGAASSGPDASIVDEEPASSPGAGLELQARQVSSGTRSTLTIFTVRSASGR